MSSKTVRFVSSKILIFSIASPLFLTGCGGSSGGGVPATKAWGTAEMIETGTLDGLSPKIAIDGSGNAIAVWYQNDGTRNSIYANRYTVGSGWGTEATIESNDTTHAYDPRIAVDSSGNAIAVWYQSDGTNNSIYANRYSAGSGWGTEALIENNAGDAAYPQVAMDTSGNAMVVWEQGGSIYATRNTVGIGWDASATLIESGAGIAAIPQIAIDGSGNAIAVWQQNDGSYDSIYANRYVAGSGWGTAVLVESSSTGNAASPQIAADSNGNAMAVWFQSDGTYDSIYANRYTVGSGWGTAGLIESDSAGAASNPQVAIEGSGNALAVWEQSDGTRINILSNRYTSGSSWGSAELIESDDTGSAGNAHIAVNSGGHAMAVWEQGNNILANHYTAGSGWGSAELIETDDTGGTSNPQVAMDSDGNAMAVWEQFDGSHTNVLSNRYD